MGIASHFGVLTQTATLGCAKKILFGKYQEPENQKGKYSEIIAKGETIGFALRKKNNTKPVFISPGNKMSLDDSLRITLRCSGNHRIPEPTRKAHEFVNLFRPGKLVEGFHEVTPQLLF